MATSGSVNFTLTAGEVVERAFSKIGVKVAEQALQAEEIQDGLDALNLFLKTMQSQSMHLWSRDEGVLFLDVGKTDYLIGPTGGCGAWKPAKHDAATVAAIDSHLPTGLSVADMRNRFPDAQRIEGDDDNGAWFIVSDERCFRCTNKRAFVSSTNHFARVARFEGGTLVAIEPVDTSGVQK